MNFLATYLLFALGFFHGSKPISILPSNATVEQFQTKYITTFDQLIANNQISGDLSEQTIKIQEVISDGLANKAGLKAGDIITAINNEDTNTLIINKQLKAVVGKTFIIEYQNSGSTTALTQSITCPDDSCMLGIVMDASNNIQVKPYKYGLIDSLKFARQELIGQSKLSLNTLGKLFGSLLSFNGDKIKAQTNNLTGPAGAIKIGELIYQSG